LAGLAAVVTWMDAGRTWLEYRRATIEIAADRHAIRSGADRRVLARALIKLNAVNLVGGSPKTSLVGFTSAVDLRVRALLGEAVAERNQATGPAPVLVAFAACLVLIVRPVGLLT